jgi:hypothetical protein
MRVVHLSYNPLLSDEEIRHHDCSDRIWVPKHMFENWLLQEDQGSLVTVRLDTVAACMYAPHSEERDILFAPAWMCNELGGSLDPPEEGDDYIVPIRTHPDVCTFLRIQPHTSNHLHCEETPEDVLSRGFEHYTCLSTGQTVTLQLECGEELVVTIVEAHSAAGPAEHGVPLCIRTSEIAMDLLEPLDAPEPVVEPVPEPVPEPVVEPVQHTNLPLTREERAALFAKAAQRRMEKDV